jgi:ferrous iron transport protein B
MDGRQLTVAAVTLTLFIPCIAQFLIMKKERGWKVAGSIGVFVSLLAFASGYVLNKALLVSGLLS